jgi:hypothetical protein
MRLATDYLRDEAYERLTKIAKEQGGELAKAINDLVAVKDKPESREKTKVVLGLLKQANKSADVEQAIKSADQLPKKSQ